MKPLTPKAQATREKILAAANDLFYLHGYTATGLDKIIAAAGVTKGNFYYHFKSKEELLIDVLDWHRDLAFRELGLDRPQDFASPLEMLIALIEGMSSRSVCSTRECRVRGCFFGNMALELATGSEAVRKKVGEIFAGFRGLARDLLEKAQAAGQIRASLDCESSAGMIISLLEGAVLLDKVAQHEDEVLRAQTFIKAYLRG